MKRALIIVNPSSGKEKAIGYAEKVQTVLEEMQNETMITYTKEEGDAERFAKTACDQKYNIIVSMGGDGTLNEIINGIALKKHRPTLGIIPMGTVNDFARALHIPLNPEEAIGLLEIASIEQVDIGKIGTRYFANTLAVGPLAEMTAEVSVEKKTALGSFAYFIEGLKSLVEKETFHLLVEGDNEKWEGEAILFLATLSNSGGGFEKLSPQAMPDDGFCHCYMIKNVPMPKLIRIVTSLLRGQLKEDPDVVYLKTREARLTADKPLYANMDGELGDELPLKVSVLPKHIGVYVKK
ncbi:diacylglycerol/lipid kinase family protein [Bacillus massilinigeriensis]|uniref:diacylglycerol/lipid kinase family protein n=1 Tax=Bacillus mediterraneensis TaxID=1805474 RepID=UPI0008F91BEF|nr:diacylglycerol kinase family protein [Bacillus mediterraneensis]